MPHKPSEVAAVKLRMIEIYAIKPDISDREMMRALAPLCHLDYRTVGKYRQQIEGTLRGIKAQVENKIEKEVGLWSRITARLFPQKPQEQA